MSRVPLLLLLLVSSVHSHAGCWEDFLSLLGPRRNESAPNPYASPAETGDFVNLNTFAGEIAKLRFGAREPLAVKSSSQAKGLSRFGMASIESGPESTVLRFDFVAGTFSLGSLLEGKNAKLPAGVYYSMGGQERGGSPTWQKIEIARMSNDSQASYEQKVRDVFLLLSGL